MHRGHLIEEMRIDQLQTRLEEFGADDQRHGAADKEHDQGKEQVQGTQILMVRSGHPPHQTLGRAMIMMIVMRCCSGHRSWTSRAEDSFETGRIGKGMNRRRR